MGIILIVKLYTSRVLLEVLGIDNYGVWNAVAAFIITFSFISNPLVTATQRFLNYDMARGGLNLSSIFMTSMQMFVMISIIVVIALETIGIWFLNNKMQFPPDSMASVNRLFQFSVLGLVVGLLRMPYESSIIAEEKMSFYACICILEALLLLSIAFLLKYGFDLDKLVAYGFLNFISTLIIMACYVGYCYRNFAYTIFRKIELHTERMKELAAFSGWNLLGACASMTATQGVTTLINMFFGVVVNATYGIAIQVQGAVSNIIFNLQKAANPQIVKSFSQNNIDRTRYLVVNMCKLSYLLTLLFALPIIFNIDYVLHLWLSNNVPPMTGLFSCLVLVLLLLVSFSGPMDTAILATGKIKNFQLAYSLIIFSNIVFVYCFFKFGFQSYWAIIVKCIVELVIITTRLIFLNKDINLKYSSFIRETILPCSLITIIGICTLWSFVTFAPSIQGLKKLILTSLVYLIVFGLSTLFFAFSNNQRRKIYFLILSKIR